MRIACLVMLGVVSATHATADPRAHTYSIVARDPATGELGVAVQSHWFAVGSIVSWAEAGVGAVATQSFVEPGYGERALALIRRGVPAPDALSQLVAADPLRDVRQVAVVDALGRVAAHTGAKAIAAAGHHVGSGYSVQANLMENARVWPAMSAAFEAAPGDLADRLIAALEAAEGVGGDIRGRQSASLIVVKPHSSERPWSGADRVFDLRVDDHRDPVTELKRLVRLQRAYNHANRGDELFADRRVDEALKEYAAAAAIAPEVAELPFWHAVTLASIGREADARVLFEDVFEREPFWADLIPRLPAAGLLPDDPALVDRITRLRKPRQPR